MSYTAPRLVWVAKREVCQIGKLKILVNFDAIRGANKQYRGDVLIVLLLGLRSAATT